MDKKPRELRDCDYRRVLLVDDEEVLTRMFADALLTSFPYLSVDSAGDGRQARDLFNEKHHGLIVMDVAMPNMNGEEAFAEIRAICDRKVLKLPSFIFCTGFDVSESLRQIVGDGSFHTCLEKPLTMGNLVRIVKKHLSRQSREPV